MVVCRKLISHRVRGFGRYENCRTAVQRACRSAVPMLEVDTRVAADGRIFVYHNPRGRYHLSERPDFSRMDAAALRRVRYPSGETLLELDECLRIFAARRTPSQRLCIDMKDVGFERAHLDLARRYGVAEQLCWMSWVPQSLRELRQLGAPGPLILAHCNLSRFGTPGRWVEAAFARSTLRVARLVLRGIDADCRVAVELHHGFQHGLLCTQLRPDVETMLRESGGGVCVYRGLFSDDMAAWCRSAGLDLWVFRVRTARGFRRLARHPGISAVFCDDAAGVIRMARRQRSSRAILALPQLQEGGHTFLA